VNEGWSYIKPITALPDFDAKVFIALLGLEDLPPHVAFIQDNTLFSLTAHGVELGSDALRIIRKLWLKRQCALVECSSSLDANLTHEIYTSFEALQSGSSCIDPICRIAEQHWNIKPKKPFVHGLLHELDKAGLVKNCYVSFQCDDVFVLKPYSQSVIDKRIEELRRT